MVGRGACILCMLTNKKQERTQHNHKLAKAQAHEQAHSYMQTHSQANKESNQAITLKHIDKNTSHRPSTTTHTYTSTQTSQHTHTHTHTLKTAHGQSHKHTKELYCNGWLLTYEMPLPTLHFFLHGAPHDTPNHSNTAQSLAAAKCSSIRYVHVLIAAMCSLPAPCSAPSCFLVYIILVLIINH